MASVWARIMASPSSSNTNEGGTITPIVADALTKAIACACPRYCSFGLSTPPSSAELEATEPFIGPMQAPRLKAAQAGRGEAFESGPAIIAKTASPTPNSAIRKPTKTYRGKACSKSLSSKPKTREGMADRIGKVNTLKASPNAAKALDTPRSKVHKGVLHKILSATKPASITIPTQGAQVVMADP